MNVHEHTEMILVLRVISFNRNPSHYRLRKRAQRREVIGSRSHSIFMIQLELELKEL